MMRVLDIDLDFFLNDVCPFADEGSRPDVSGREPWDKERVSGFLTDNLGLKNTRPIPGRVFETHDGALFFWRDMMKQGALSAPFSVTHIDAHTDLGVAQRGYPFVKHNVLARSPENRCDIDFYKEIRQLNEANYLSFALAFRWVGELINVRNPKSKADMPKEMLSGDGRFLHLESAFPMLFEKKYGTEMYVPYFEYGDYRAFSAPEPFDFMSLAVSPRYSPAEADQLIDRIMAFSRPV
ncbi:MAG: UPF0489 family protein [Clostridia bacterium]|nr:UPF0489 family protein [Clostridia bacterium]MBQ4158539.1 UPF0489 family protein [Clostridia bacterium]